MRSKNFNQPMGPKHEAMLPDILACVLGSTEPLNVEGVRQKLNYSRGAFVAVRTVLVHLHSHGKLAARMIQGSMHYFAPNREEVVGTYDLKKPKKKNSVEIEYVHQAGVFQVRVRRRGRQVTVALPFGSTPSTLSAKELEAKVQRGLHLLDKMEKQEVLPPVPAPSSSQEIPVEDLRKGELDRVKNRWAARP